MLHAGLQVWWLLAVVGLVLLGWYWLHSREGRVERRRRKSHSRIVSKTGRPTVKFSVRPPKEK